MLDHAVEWNDRIRLHASGGRAEVGFVSNAAWRPKITLGYQSFSGDDPNTPQLERFDPLNYEGSPGAWATGSKSSMVFINTNVRAIQRTLELAPSPRDFIALYLAHVRANELRSPLQFGQATRVEYTDGVTAGFSASFPGPGIDRLLGKHAPVWTGWLVNVVFTY